MGLNTDESAAARYKARKIQEAKRDAHKKRWASASARRESWTNADFAEEESRLEAEIAELVAAGVVTVYPARWAAGSTGGSLFAD